MTGRNWHDWHTSYAEPGSPLARRLAVVQAEIRGWLASAPPGDLRVVSGCAGQGRDLIEVLADHRRGGDVAARLVELDPRNAAAARALAEASGLHRVEVVEADAGTGDAYAGAVPADLVLMCGVFGNVPDGDVHRTVRALPGLCADRARVIWTRHRRPPDLTLAVRAWFAEAGFTERAFHTRDDARFAVGVHDLRGQPAPFVAGVRLFEFVE